MRIAIVALGSRGDVQPCVAIGKGLRRAGHSVRVVTHAPIEEFVLGNGLDFSTLGVDAARWGLDGTASALSLRDAETQEAGK